MATTQFHRSGSHEIGHGEGGLGDGGLTTFGPSCRGDVAVVVAGRDWTNRPLY